MSKKTYKIKKDDELEDALLDKSAYGEFIANFNHWTGLEGSKERAQYLSEVAEKTSGKDKRQGDIQNYKKEE
ncbi:MAG: hypothetical protein PWP48_1039 [Clostridiales bacterium]|jgi:hypothetical protein|nr:hypothetical protein [Clostridiales bacterium]